RLVLLLRTPVSRAVVPCVTLPSGRGGDHDGERGRAPRVFTAVVAAGPVRQRQLTGGPAPVGTGRLGRRPAPRLGLAVPPAGPVQRLGVPQFDLRAALGQVEVRAHHVVPVGAVGRLGEPLRHRYLVQRLGGTGRRAAATGERDEGRQGEGTQDGSRAHGGSPRTAVGLRSATSWVYGAVTDHGADERRRAGTGGRGLTVGWLYPQVQDVLVAASAGVDAATGRGRAFGWGRSRGPVRWTGSWRSVTRTPRRRRG